MTGAVQPSEHHGGADSGNSLPKMVMNGDIPWVDFKAFLHGSAHDRERVASTIDAALSSVGFIYLSNHGIDQGKVDECFRWVSDLSSIYT